MPGMSSTQADQIFAKHPVQMTEAPVSGAVITITESDRHVVMNIMPDGPLASLTIVFPDTGRMGQRFTISTTQDIASLTLDDVPYGAISSLSGGDCFEFYRQSPTKIYRVLS